MDKPPRSPGLMKERKSAMTIHRIFDVVVTYAVLGLTLTVAGATAVLGA